MLKVPPTDPKEREADACRAVLEKVTILNLVQVGSSLSLQACRWELLTDPDIHSQAFGVSLKHCESLRPSEESSSSD
jgi:hypothetical protein